MKIDTILKQLEFIENSIHESIPCMLKPGNSKERDNLVASEEVLKHVLSVLLDFIKLQEDLKLIKSEYNGPAVTGYHSKKVDRIRKAELNRSEPMGAIESTIIKEMEHDIAVVENWNEGFLKTTTLKDLKNLRTRIINSIRKELTGRDVPTVSLIQVHAFMVVFMAWNNMGKVRLLTDALVLPGHMDMQQMEGVFERLMNLGWKLDDCIDMLHEDARGALIRYCMENYNGVSMDAIEKFYFKSEL